ncbi:hypothetical protein BVRB_8g198420 [Beta vulgaris subsp. vulgaris]|nr:hypothetical protein BVRB_8g198420 [Beta vulgaris subsp. vulgaris]
MCLPTEDYMFLLSENRSNKSNYRSVFQQIITALGSMSTWNSRSTQWIRNQMP